MDLEEGIHGGEIEFGIISEGHSLRSRGELLPGGNGKTNDENAAGLQELATGESAALLFISHFLSSCSHYASFINPAARRTARRIPTWEPQRHFSPLSASR